MSAYMAIGALNQLTGEGDVVSAAALFIEPSAIGPVTERFKTLPVIEWLSNSECPDSISLSRSGGFETYRDRGQFDQRMLEAFDELSHEDKIKRVDAVARKVVMRITEKGRIGDHERGPTYVPKRSVIA